MSLNEVFGQAWTRKHDNPLSPKVPLAPRITHPVGLADLVNLCATHEPDQHLHAAGSHWALSDAAISDHTFIETHDPNGMHPAMGKTLYDVIPNCMNDAFITALAKRKVKPFDTQTVSENEGLYPVHIETGKRIYQAYAELDGGDTAPQSLANLLADNFGNPDYLGPWAFRTLGGAGGQTVFGALHTGTHGGDINMRPIADSVMALHLVVDGGHHFWIEPHSLRFPIEAHLTDESKLKAFYGKDEFGGPNNFTVLRNDDLFDAVLVSAGRFGVVYSIVIATVRQYTLHQERRLTTWEAIKSQVKDTASPLYTTMADPLQSRNRFLQIAISVTPHGHFKLHQAGVTKRRNVAMAVVPNSTVPAGRAERVGAIINLLDPQIQGPRFAAAGASHPYDPDPAHPGKAAPADFLELACSDANFIAGVIKTVMQELKDFISSNGNDIGWGIAAVAAVGGGGLLALLAALFPFLAILAALAISIESNAAPRFGQVMNQIRVALLSDPDPQKRQAGLLIWQMISASVFEKQQGNSDYEAISYAVMDTHDYLDLSCRVNVQSIEVFFDATDPLLTAFVDALLTFEIGQEVTSGRAFVGYISLRFMGPTRALLGPQKFPVTCAVEVAGLADVAGTKELIDFAVALALDPNVNGILHWGQRNDSNRAQIEARFGDPAPNKASAMATWRKALRALTNNGELTGFSSEFTRHTGLEPF
ncbi:hypothetical protein [Pseudoduganella violacea]|uniref:Uncharacterized protein n=1 Tax=Pseudoduganella violacea TaxID=1715466 RepID=A0A7W5FX42_9BURK|nr:hypothetical protein [Pseudoduganella violacea]MBB3122467.1 hypothetical protein [Pseudoduganella violacea]